MKLQMIPLVLLAGLAAGPSGAQVTPESPVTPASPTAVSPARPVVVSPDYKIAEGDVLGVNVVNFPNLSTPQTMVTPGGNISVPLLDQVPVVGMTQDQVKRLLTARWRKYVINPAVNVFLTQKHAQVIRLSGSLNHTGSIDYTPDLHVLQALAQMGGALPSADATKAVLQHTDGTQQVLDLSNPETKAGTDVDVLLQPGDVLIIPDQKGKVSVTGDGIKQPGSIYFKENLTLLDAINASGGILSDTADLPGATLTRNGSDTKIDLQALLRGGNPKADIMLQPGDHVNVPELHNRTYVTGDVSHQGWYYYKPGDTIRDALSSAGLQPDSDTGKINLIRNNKDKTEALMVHVNFDDFQLRGKTSGNPPVQPGDSLYIPKKHEQFNANSLLQTLTGVGALANTTYLLRTVH